MASKNSVRKPLKLPKNKSKNCKSMEIDIFPIPHRKDGMARNFDKGFLGILIISYIIAAFQKGR